MIRLLLTAATLLLGIAAASADPIDEAVADEVVAGAEAIRDATLKGDFEVVIESMHPALMEMLGGRENALEAVTAMKQQMADMGMSFASYTIDRPEQVYAAADDFLVFLPTHAVLESETMLIETDSYLIAARPRDGGKWTYIDGSGVRDPSGLALIFEGFPEDAEIPAKDLRTSEK